MKLTKAQEKSLKKLKSVSYDDVLTEQEVKKLLSRQKKEIIEELELLKKKSKVTVRNEISRKWDIDSSNTFWAYNAIDDAIKTIKKIC